MPILSALVSHWGYLAIFGCVILGNLGLPVPEESILVLAGYLTWQRALVWPLVLVVGIASAVAGDNLGYWLGRRYGQGAIERFGQRVMLTSARIEATRRFVCRYGAFGVFVARFLPGLRFMAGPLAGSTGLRPLRFITANALGALLYVPTMVGAGYAIGYGLGDYVKPFERVVGRIEHVVLIAAALCTMAFLGWRVLRAARARRHE
jgi:membrane protein DedA with SNARE-associated domain